jgi:predicted metal-dependent HD superfamily phosphohydrolase
MSVENLERRWERLMAAWELPKHGEELRKVSAAYAEKGRHYHTLDHIRFCLQKLDEFRDHVRRPERIELAIWYHDVVNDTHGAENEESSGKAFLEFAERVGLHPKETRVGFVHSTILATTHTADTLHCHPDSLLMLDIDLLSLAKPADEFDTDSKAVRKEYPHLSPSMYEMKKNAFFKSLLDRGNLFWTEAVREKYEAIAKRNLSRAVLYGKSS